mmetsp:Transcript_97129/g.243535  ORF Transcript_97129/g.243535 Transcript_97129/m.243535 type:complete len:295 (+) Transcript_97129:1573-2457(+)
MGSKATALGSIEVCPLRLRASKSASTFKRQRDFVGSAILMPQPTGRPPVPPRRAPSPHLGPSPSIAQRSPCESRSSTALLTQASLALWRFHQHRRASETWPCSWAAVPRLSLLVAPAAAHAEPATGLVGAATPRRRRRTPVAKALLSGAPSSSSAVPFNFAAKPRPSSRHLRTARGTSMWICLAARASSKRLPRGVAGPPHSWMAAGRPCRHGTQPRPRLSALVTTSTSGSACAYLWPCPLDSLAPSQSSSSGVLQQRIAPQGDHQVENPRTPQSHGLHVTSAPHGISQLSVPV